MKKKLSIFSLGIAIFTMIFGAGNIVYPLILGRETGSQISFSMIGFILTAVIVPIIGLAAAILFEGDYKRFLKNTGKLPSIIFMFVIMLFIIGPLGAMTRCLILSYSALKIYMPGVPIYAYCAVALFLVYLLTRKENKVVDILGTILGPIKITLLVAIIVIGLASVLSFVKVPITPTEGFVEGTKVGYYTLDLIGMIFFSRLIYDAMKTKFDQFVQPKKIIVPCLKAGLICAVLLGAIYFGFGIVSAAFSSKLKGVADEQLLSILSIRVLGKQAGILANLTVAVSTLATATALVTLFSDYLTFTVFRGKVSYNKSLIITILAGLAAVNLDFEGIMKIIAPIAVAVYPALIVLTLGNIANKLFNFKEKYIMISVWIAFGLTMVFQYILPNLMHT